MPFPLVFALLASLATIGLIVTTWQDIWRNQQPRPTRPTPMTYLISYTDKHGNPATTIVTASSRERARLRFVSQHLGLEVTGVELIPND